MDMDNFSIKIIILLKSILNAFYYIPEPRKHNGFLYTEVETIATMMMDKMIIKINLIYASVSVTWLRGIIYGNVNKI